MRPVEDLSLGFNDAENYRRRENKSLFDSIFVRNYYLDRLLQPSIYFLVGEKGTGKTAYSVYLSNSEYKNTVAELKFIRETDYQKFVVLRQQEHLQLSDFASVWRVILLLLLCKSIQQSDLDHGPFAKNRRLKSVNDAIDEYYNSAFSPEIMHALAFVDDTSLAVSLLSKHLNLSATQQGRTETQNSRFQVSLLYIERQMQMALSDLKLRKNRVVFIDGIDIRPGTIPYPVYLDCVKGLSNAVWSLNNDFLAGIRDSPRRLRIVILLRPDIFNSVGMQNEANKIRDNSVYLDWRTTYADFPTSSIFELSDRLLSAQQLTDGSRVGDAWDHYFPWRSRSTSPSGEPDHSFVDFLRLSYSRPRDIVTMMQILREIALERRKAGTDRFAESIFRSHEFENRYSEYLLGGVRDQLAFYYTPEDFEMFLTFFLYLDGKGQFGYEHYKNAYARFTDYLLNNHPDVPEFVETADTFLQFLYDTNILCYIEDGPREPLFRFCYRERSPSHLKPRVRIESVYRVHYGLKKALNLSY